MSSYTCEAISTGPASRDELDKQEKSLAAAIDDLAVLRFSIVLTAKWEAFDSEDAERRDELHSELASLRHLYSEKLDEIAMTFGVDHAMKAKAKVEGSFRAERELKTAIAKNDSKQLYF